MNELDQTTTPKPRLPRVLFVLGLVAIGGVLGAIIATAVPAIASGVNGGNQTAASTTTTANTYCQTYLSTLESQLHVSQQQLINANAAAIKAALQQAVTNGKLTQAQATQIESKISSLTSGDICAALSRFGVGGHRGAFPAGPLLAARQAILQAIATKLNLSVTTLQSDLASGQSLVTIASHQGVSQSTLNATILAAVKTQLDSAVSKNEITSAQETQLMTVITNAVNAGQYGFLGLGAPNPGMTPPVAPSGFGN